MRNIVYIITITIILLLLTSCKVNLDVKVKKYIDNNCVCDINVCQCIDTYSEENVVYIDCTGVEISSMSDVIRDCNYWNIIDGWRWERNGEPENKSV